MVTKREKVPGLRFSYVDSMDKRIKIYKRPGASMQFNGIEMQQIDYHFVDELFFRAYLMTSGSSNYAKLEKALMKRYGKWNDSATFKDAPTGKNQPLKTQCSYWVGDTTYIILCFTPTPANSLVPYDAVTVSLCSQKIAKACVYKKRGK